jgi:hypothetical protein
MVPSTLGTVVQIASGVGFVCALDDSGQVACWGSNEYGQTDVPATLANVVHIGAGALQTCAVDDAWQVTCWGIDPDGIATPASLAPIAQVACGEVGGRGRRIVLG